MIHDLTITVLVDDVAGRPDLAAEHGIAFHVTADGRRLLFDTGQGRVLAGNARALGVSPAEVEAVVLSHGHYDHAGGLAQVLRAAPAARLFLHPAALEEKYALRSGGRAEPIGMSRECRAAIEGHAGGTVWTAGPTEVFPGVLVTGEIPRRTDFEDPGGPFFLDPACGRPDPLADDQALVLLTREGPVVLLGCGHAGVVNTLDRVEELIGAREAAVVGGGMHLLRADDRRLEETMRGFQRHAVGRILPGHCTGARGREWFRRRFPDRYRECAAGTTFTVPG